MEVPEFKREITSPIPEHQVLLSFLNDQDAIDFTEWYIGEGHDIFEEYLEIRFPSRNTT